jgi:hypothetical protein
MKRIGAIALGITVIILPLFLLGGSCNGGGMPAYFLSFTLDDQEYVYDKGLTDVDANAFGHVDGSSTFLYGAPETGLDTGNLPDTFILTRFPGTSTGTWEYEGDSILSFTYMRDGEYYYPDLAGETSVTITTYGAVGETIEGTFTAYVKDDTTGTVFLELTDGVIKVKRLEDDSVSWP